MELKKILLAAAVGILLALFFGFLIDALYGVPGYETFCNYPDHAYPKTVPAMDLKNCTYVVDNETYSDCLDKNGIVEYDYDAKGCVSNTRCNTCYHEFELARERYSRNLFFILVPISLVLIIIGFFLSLESIGSGFILGGILTIAYATIRIFGDLSKFMRVILLGIELIIVIWLGYNRIEKANSKKKR